MVWRHLDLEHAADQHLRRCASLLPPHVNYGQQRDMMVKRGFESGSAFDWKHLTTAITAVHDIASRRAGTFRVHMADEQCVEFYCHLAAEFSRLAKLDHSHRSIIFPRCRDQRALVEKLAFVLALCALLNPVPGRVAPLVDLLGLGAELGRGARDGILAALQCPTQSANSKLSLSFSEADDAEPSEENAAPTTAAEPPPPPPHAGFDDGEEMMDEDSEGDSDEDDDEDEDEYAHDPEATGDECRPTSSPLLSISELHQIRAPANDRRRRNAGIIVDAHCTGVDQT